MKWITPSLTVLAAFFLSSCDVELTPPDNKAPEPRVGINQPIRPIAKLNQQEVAIAQRLCLNVRAQRLHLGSLPNGTIRNFSVQEKNCSTQRTSTQNISASLNLSGALYLWSPQRNITFHSQILTDRSAELDRFCEDVQSSANMENTLLVGSRYIRYEFKAFSSVDRISLVTHESVQGQWRVQRIDEYEIDKSMDPNLRGQTTASRHLFVCRPNSNVGELIQRLR